MTKKFALTAAVILMAGSALAGNSQTYNCNRQPDENNLSADRCSTGRTGEAVSKTRAEKAAKDKAAKSVAAK